MDVSSYLTRIGFESNGEDLKPDLETLNELSRCHQLTVPFENLDVLMRKPIVLELESLFTKIVSSGRGGWCHELNGLFHWLLKELGYDAWMINCMVREPTRWPVDFAHMGIMVKLEDEEIYFVDVGFGDYRAPLFPLKTDPLDVPIEMSTGVYKLTLTEPENVKGEEEETEEYYYMLFQPTDAEDKDNQWQTLLRFKTEPHGLEDFEGTCTLFQEEGYPVWLQSLPYVAMKTDDGTSAYMFMSRKFRHYKNTQLMTKETKEKEDDLTLEDWTRLLKEKLEIEDIDTSQFKPCWKGDDPVAGVSVEEEEEEELEEHEYDSDESDDTLSFSIDDKHSKKAVANMLLPFCC